jgi:hypothetical protein
MRSGLPVAETYANTFTLLFLGLWKGSRSNRSMQHLSVHSRDRGKERLLCSIVGTRESLRGHSSRWIVHVFWRGSTDDSCEENRHFCCLPEIPSCTPLADHDQCSNPTRYPLRTTLASGVWPGCIGSFGFSANCRLYAEAAAAFPFLLTLASLVI